MASLLPPRAHIQNFSEAKILEYHWGYAERALPCTKDAGSCAYLDAVYWMHDVSMLYTFQFWIVLGCLGLFVLGARFLNPPLYGKRPAGSNEENGTDTVTATSSLYKIFRAACSLQRRYLVPYSVKMIFGRVSRLQLLILFILVCYLTIFSFVGIVYQTWITPVTDHPELFNTRTGGGGFSDRLGAFAFALTPLAVMLGTRESILSLATGIAYNHFIFLHRWTGRIILVQSLVYAAIWTVVEGKMYQPQPNVFNEWIAQEYMIYGCVAIGVLLLLAILSTRWAICLTGYEFFRKTHYILALLYIGTCWGHWKQLMCWMIASFVLCGFDLALRIMRTLLVHFKFKRDNGQGFSFRSITALARTFIDQDSHVVRLEFTGEHNAWRIGQHFHLTFPGISVWQSHPFTPSSVPQNGSNAQRHVYIIRAQKGETARLYEYCRVATAGQNSEKVRTTLPVVVSGPSGCGVAMRSASSPNLLAIAGGTGITFPLPAVLSALYEGEDGRGGAIELVWVIRRASNMHWILPELVTLVRHGAMKRISERLRVRIFITRSESTEPENSQSRNPAVTVNSGHGSHSSVASGLSQWEFKMSEDETEDMSMITAQNTEKSSGIGQGISVIEKVVSTKDSASTGTQELDGALQWIYKSPVFKSPICPIVALLRKNF